MKKIKLNEVPVFAIILILLGLLLIIWLAFGRPKWETVSGDQLQCRWSTSLNSRKIQLVLSGTFPEDTELKVLIPQVVTDIFENENGVFEAIEAPLAAVETMDGASNEYSYLISSSEIGEGDLHLSFYNDDLRQSEVVVHLVTNDKKKFSGIQVSFDEEPECQILELDVGYTLRYYREGHIVRLYVLDQSGEWSCTEYETDYMNIGYPFEETLSNGEVATCLSFAAKAEWSGDVLVYNTVNQTRLRLSFQSKMNLLNDDSNDENPYELILVSAEAEEYAGDNE